MATSGNSDDGSGIYDFKDNKTTGTVTITKKWDDGLTNAEREIPDMYLSTEKPSKSTKGYTITFHGNGLKFADGTDENMVVYNSSGQIVEGSYKEAVGTGIGWYANKELTQKVEISDDGVPQIELTGDLDLWAKEMTFTLTSSYGFRNKIPDTTTEVIFTDEVKPKGKEIIDVDADEDGGVVAWLDDDAGEVMKVSAQIPGVKVQAAKYSSYMFEGKGNLQKIDLKMLDTQNVTSMESMFSGCSGLTSLDLTPLDTSNVINMDSMFANCSELINLNLTSLDTSKVKNMCNLFFYCKNLTELNLNSFNTKNVTDMSYMFVCCANLKNIDCSKMNAGNVTSAYDMFSNCEKIEAISLPNFSKKLIGICGYTQKSPIDRPFIEINGMFEKCRNLTNLNLSNIDMSNIRDTEYMFYDCRKLNNIGLAFLKNTQKVKNMSYMFSGCSSLTSLDLTSLDTSNVTDMNHIFSDCSSLTSLDLTSFNTQNVKDMSNMFGGFTGCKKLTNLDISSFKTQNVENMYFMFSGCSSLTSLDLTPLDTQNVTNMGYMFSGCSGLTGLDLTPLNTQNVMNMSWMFSGCSGLTSLDLTPLDTQNVTDMEYMLYHCFGMTSFTTGTTFKFVGTKYALSGTWQNTAGETFTSGKFPSNVADTYTKMSS